MNGQWYGAGFINGLLTGFILGIAFLITAAFVASNDTEKKDK